MPLESYKIFQSSKRSCRDLSHSWGEVLLSLKEASWRTVSLPSSAWYWGYIYLTYLKRFLVHNTHSFQWKSLMYFTVLSVSLGESREIIEMYLSCSPDAIIQCQIQNPQFNNILRIIYHNYVSPFIWESQTRLCNLLLTLHRNATIFIWTCWAGKKRELWVKGLWWTRS